MVQVIMKPEIFKYATCKEFAEGFALGAEDLVLTNKFIFCLLYTSPSPRD